MLAKEVQEGDFVDLETGRKRVTDVQRIGGFRMALEGHPDRAAIMVSYGRDWTLFHPEEDVSDCVTRP